MVLIGSGLLTLKVFRLGRRTAPCCLWGRSPSLGHPGTKLCTNQKSLIDLIVVHAAFARDLPNMQNECVLFFLMDDLNCASPGPN